MKNLTVLERRKSLNLFENFKSLKHPEVYIADSIEDYAGTKFRQPKREKLEFNKRDFGEFLMIIPNLSIEEFDYKIDICFADNTDKLNFNLNRYFFPEGYIEKKFFDLKRFENYSIIFAQEYRRELVQLQGIVFQSEIDNLLRVVKNPFPKNLSSYVIQPNQLRLITFEKEAL